MKISNYNDYILENFNNFEITDKDREEILFSPDGFNNREEAEEYLDSILNWNYSNLPDEFWLYRVIFIDNEKDFKLNNLGKHWTIEVDNIFDDEWIENIRETNDLKGNPWIIRAKFKFEDINQENTLKNNILYPHEEEITLKDNSKPIEFDIFKLEDIRKINIRKIREFNNKQLNNEIKEIKNRS